MVNINLIFFIVIRDDTTSYSIASKTLIHLGTQNYFDENNFYIRSNIIKGEEFEIKE